MCGGEYCIVWPDNMGVVLQKQKSIHVNGYSVWVQGLNYNCDRPNTTTQTSGMDMIYMWMLKICTYGCVGDLELPDFI